MASSSSDSETLFTKGRLYEAIDLRYILEERINGMSWMQLLKQLQNFFYLEFKMPARHPRWRCPEGRWLPSPGLRSSGAGVLTSESSTDSCQQFSGLAAIQSHLWRFTKRKVPGPEQRNQSLRGDSDTHNRRFMKVEETNLPWKGETVSSKCSSKPQSILLLSIRSLHFCQ